MITGIFTKIPIYCIIYQVSCSVISQKKKERGFPVEELKREAGESAVALVTFIGTLCLLLFAVAFATDIVFDGVAGPTSLGISASVVSLPGFVWWLSPWRPTTDWWLIGIAFGSYLSAFFVGALGFAVLIALGVYEAFLFVGFGLRVAEFVSAFLCFSVIGTGLLALFYVLGTEEPVTMPMLRIIGQRIERWVRHNARRAFEFVRHWTRRGSKAIVREVKEVVGDLTKEVKELAHDLMEIVADTNWSNGFAVVSARRHAERAVFWVRGLSLKPVRQQLFFISQVAYHGALRLKEILS